MITIYRSEKDGKFYWRITHPNGNLIADGGEGYNRPMGAINGLRAAKAVLDKWDGKTYLQEKKKKVPKLKQNQGTLRYPVKDPETTQNDLDQAPDRWQR